MIDAHLGPGVVVRQYASVVRGAVIGARTSIGPCALVDAATVGADCKIGHAAAIHPGVVIGDRVFVGPGVIFCNDAWPEVSREGFTVVPTIHVEHGASIGAGAIILPGVRIGAGALVAAGAVVRHDVPAGRLYTREGDDLDIPIDRRRRRVRACSP